MRYPRATTGVPLQTGKKTYGLDSHAQGLLAPKCSNTAGFLGADNRPVRFYKCAQVGGAEGKCLCRYLVQLTPSLQSLEVGVSRVKKQCSQRFTS